MMPLIPVEELSAPWVADLRCLCESSGGIRRAGDLLGFSAKTLAKVLNGSYWGRWWRVRDAVLSAKAGGRSSLRMVVGGKSDGLPAPATEAQQRMWQSMRMMRRFQIPDLVMTASVGTREAQRYCRALFLAGILERIGDSRRSPDGLTTYWLVGNSGTRAPVVLDGERRHVWDHNRRCAFDLQDRDAAREVN